MTANVEIRGLNPLRSRLNNITNPVKIESALDYGAMLVERDAKQIVRVDTGALKNSISIKKIKLGRKIGSSKIYASAQEFGRTDLSGYGYTPYLRPALRKNRNEIVQAVRKAIAETG